MSIEVIVTGAGGASADVIGYGEGEQIRTYLEKCHVAGRHLLFRRRERRGSTQVVATQTASDGTHNAVLATQTGGNNVFFATEGMLADSNMLQHAIGWAARAAGRPELKLQMGRQASMFAARNDMDQSQEAQRRQRRASTPSLLRHPRAVEDGFQFRRLLLRQYRQRCRRWPDHRLDDVEARLRAAAGDGQ